MIKARLLGLITIATALSLLAAPASHAAGLDPFELYTVGTGAGPSAVAYAPGRVFVGNNTSGTVVMIDEATGEVDRSVFVGAAPHGLAVNAALGRVYVAVGSSNKIHVLNAVTGAPLGPALTVPQCVGATGGWGIAVNPVTNVVYVACYSANTLVALDGATGAVLAAVPTAGGPLGLVADPATNLVYLGHFGAAEVRVIDGASLRTLLTVSRGLSAGNWGLALDPVSRSVFVANYNAGTITTILGNRVIATAGGFSGPEWIAYDPVRTRVWVPESKTNRVTALDVVTGETAPVAVRGTTPVAVAVNPAGLVYSANYGSGTVSAILN